MIKTIKDYLNNVYINYRHNKIISKFDFENNILDTDNNDVQHLKKNGYIILENFIDPKSLIINEEINWIQIGNAVKNVDPFVIKKNSISHLIISNERVKDILLNYLGPDAVLDYVEFQKTKINSSNESISEKWHYDNVGKRIKIFLFFNDCQDIFTEYLIGTNNIYHKKYSTKDSRIKDSLVKKNIHNLAIIYPKKGNLLILDTNGYHRGVYRNFENNTVSKSSRIMLLMEFSNVNKSQKFYNISNIIGPRYIFIDKEIKTDEILLDKKSLIDFKDFYLYDSNYVKSF